MLILTAIRWPAIFLTFSMAFAGTGLSSVANPNGFPLKIGQNFFRQAVNKTQRTCGDWKVLELKQLVSICLPNDIVKDPEFEVEGPNSIGFRGVGMFLTLNYVRRDGCTSRHFFKSNGKIEIVRRRVGGRPARIVEQSKGDRQTVYACVSNVGDGRHQFEAEIVCPECGKRPELRSTISGIFDSVSFPSMTKR